MTDEEWKAFEPDILANWGTADDKKNQARLALWVRRYQDELATDFAEAMRILENQSRHWPAVSEVNAVLDMIKGRRQAALRGQMKGSWEDGPLSAKEWRMRGEECLAAAEDRVRTGRGKRGDKWHDYLTRLGEFYRQNAMRVQAEQEPLWPPPTFDGFAAPWDVKPEDQQDFYRDSREDEAEAQLA